MNAFRWDTGVQLHAANEVVDATAAVTAGTPSNPRLSDDNNGHQLASRVAVRPVSGLVVGGSVARGPFVGQTAARAALDDQQLSDFTQVAWGTDVEYARDYYILRLETVVSTWTIPLMSAPGFQLPLRAVATSVEGRYKLRPGLYAAARLDHLGFSEIVGSVSRDTWDAPVTRLELGGGYSIQRNLLLKLEYQHNTRDGGRVHRLDLGAAQIVFWF